MSQIFCYSFVYEQLVQGLELLESDSLVCGQINFSIGGKLFFIVRDICSVRMLGIR